MKLSVAIGAVVALLLTTPLPLAAQSNNDEYTPLNSRIKRTRQFPLELPNRFNRQQVTSVTRARSRAMLGQFTACLYNRSNEQSLDLLGKTDLGFVSFDQIQMDGNRATRLFGFSDCLTRVAESRSSSVQLSFTPGSLRRWLLEEAYLDRYADGPSWVKAGYEIPERVFPLSQNVASVRSVMDFADCVVQADPYGADFYFRAAPGSPDEQGAINGLMPALGPCLPQGQQVQLQPEALRVWIGEALWHAANTARPAAAPAPAAGGLH